MSGGEPSSRSPGEEAVQEFTLKEDNELRFEVASGGDVVVELVEGRAEVFGTELIQHKKYAFAPGSRVAIFTWKKAVVELVGKTESVYIAEQTPMVIYLNTHAGLEQMRESVDATQVQGQDPSRGPCLMVVGPTDVGKSTVCRILCNYAVREGRTPIFVDLDVGQGSISVPGTVGAQYVEKTADIVEGFDKKAPIVFHFGAITPSANIALYDMLVKQLAEVVSLRKKASIHANVGGTIINTCGWVKGDGYHCMVKAAEHFEVDVVVVLDHERLYNDLQRDLPNFVKILHQPKSGGVENRSRDMRLAARNAAVHKYFYGTRASPLYPHTFEVAFNEVILCKIGGERLPPELLPFGMQQEDYRTKVVTLQPSTSVVYHMFSLSPCNSLDEPIAIRNILGCIVVTAVDVDKQCFTVLSPQPHPLPAKILIYSEVTFMDDDVRL